MNKIQKPQRDEMKCGTRQLAYRRRSGIRDCKNNKIQKSQKEEMKCVVTQLKYKCSREIPC